MIWSECRGQDQITPIAGTLFRLVESQEQVATTHLVDDLAEQELLEQMLDESKPPYPDVDQPLHYLLTTPFRYPPLYYGSRFGRTHEPSLFYGGLDEITTFAESAYYRFVYWYSMEGEPPKAFLTGQHSMFTVDYSAQSGVQLHQPPFIEFRAALTDPVSYSITQQLGSEMRQAGVKAFEFESARHVDGRNVAFYEPDSFVQNAPTQLSPVVSKATASKVEFRNIASGTVHSFSLMSFQVDGELPLPA